MKQEENKFLKSLRASLKDVKEGRVYEHEFESE